jgi:hypothetical protein
LIVGCAWARVPGPHVILRPPAVPRVMVGKCGIRYPGAAQFEEVFVTGGALVKDEHAVGAEHIWRNFPISRPSLALPGRPYFFYCSVGCSYQTLLAAEVSYNKLR